MSRPGYVTPLKQSWYWGIRAAQRDRVDKAVRRALNSRPSLTLVAVESGLKHRRLEQLRSGNTSITREALDALAPLIGTTTQAVLDGSWAP